jgi:hypothetical protein
MKITWGEKLGRPECPYLIRWMIVTKWGSVRIHHWRFGDDPRAKHDHQWNFITIVLRGSYADITPEGRELLRAGAIRFRSATHVHTVDTKGCWTLLLTGRPIREWGFWSYTKGGKFRWYKHNKYFYINGHHPCK